VYENRFQVPMQDDLFGREPLYLRRLGIFKNLVKLPQSVRRAQYWFTALFHERSKISVAFDLHGAVEIGTRLIPGRS
jgi:hypothetical protein